MCATRFCLKPRDSKQDEGERILQFVEPGISSPANSRGMGSTPKQALRVTPAISQTASCRAILASVRAMASRAMRDSSGVAGRKPCFFKIRSQAATVNGFSGCWGTRTENPLISVREEKPDVFFRVGLEITDGIIKNLFSTGLEKPFLFKKSFLYSEDVAVGRAVRGVVSGNAMFAAGNLSNEQNNKGNDPPVLGISPGENVPAVEPLREFLVRHPGRMSRGPEDGNHLLLPGATRGKPCGPNVERLHEDCSRKRTQRSQQYAFPHRAIPPCLCVPCTLFRPCLYL